jgi:hypothetical protein
MNKQQAAKAEKAKVAKLAQELSTSAKKCKDAGLDKDKANEKSAIIIQDSILAHADKLKQLLNLFGVTAGQHGKRLDFGDEYFLRDEYIRKRWGCTPSHMLRVLGIYKAPPVVPNEKKKLFIEGKAAGIAEATSPTFVADMKEAYNKRDEVRISATRDAFTETKNENSFASSLIALLDAIEKVSATHVTAEIYNASKKVRSLFSKASAASLQQVKNVEGSHKPSTDKFFANPTETGDQFPATPKGAKPPKAAATPLPPKNKRKRNVEITVGGVMQFTPVVTTSSAREPEFLVACYQASDGCRYGVFRNTGRVNVDENGKPSPGLLQNYATAKEAEANIKERLDIQAKAAAATSGEVF